MLAINEIFHSIQGEGSRAGRPCVFVRLQGCGLRCKWCDTAYALNRNDAAITMDIAAVLDAVRSYAPCNFVELTGGEPLEQEDAFALLTALCDAGYETAVETGGHVDISQVDRKVIVIMDVKCPGSGMSGRNRIENLGFLKPADEVKFVLGDEADYIWAREFVLANDLTSKVGEVIFSPVFGMLDARSAVEWILRDGLKVRMQLQMHKYVWGPDFRGV